MKSAFANPLSWAVFSKIGESAIRFTSNLVLTKLLVPEAFGLMATAQVILSMIDLFTDLGIRTSLIQNPSGEKKEYLNTAWSISIFRGIIIFGILFIAAPFLSDFYNEIRLTMVIQVLSISVVIQSFANPALSLLFRRLETQKQLYWEIGSQFIGFVLTAIVAIIFPSVWAMIVGYLMTSIVRVALSYWLIPYAPKWEINPEVKNQLMSFGKHILINTLTTWLFFNIDKLLISKLFGVTVMGSYIIGLNIALIIEQMVIQLFYKIMFPTFSRLADKPDLLKEKLFNYSNIMTSLTTICLAVLFISSESIVHLLYGKSFALAALVICWISVRSIFHLQFGIYSSFLISIGKPALVSAATVGGLLVFGISFSVYGTAISLNQFFSIMIVSSFSMMIISLLFATRELKTGFGMFFRNMLKSAIIFFSIIMIKNGIEYLISQSDMISKPDVYINTILTVIISSPLIFMVGRNAVIKWNAK